MEIKEAETKSVKAPIQNALLPCPFCGSEAKLLGGPEWWVTCTFKGVCIAERRGGCTFVEDAIRIWNKRAAPSVLVAVEAGAALLSKESEVASLQRKLEEAERTVRNVMAEFVRDEHIPIAKRAEYSEKLKSIKP